MKLKNLTLAQKRSVAGYLFISPFLAGFIFFFMTPIVKSIIFSFSKISLGKSGMVLTNVGFSNYYDMLFVQTDFIRSTYYAVANMAANVPSIIIFSFFAATLLNQKFKGRTFARAIFFLPVIMASGVILKTENLEEIKNIVLHAAYQSSGGTNRILKALELKEYLYQIGFNPYIVNYAALAVGRILSILNSSGVQILIFLAALQSIPPSLYEASNIEGATGWENFWKISFPMVSPYILTNVVYSIIDNFTVYTNNTMQLIQNTAFRDTNFGMSAAMGWIYFIAISIILFVVVLLISKKVFYYQD